MSSQSDADIPLPVSILLEQQIDEEAVVALEYDKFSETDEYTDGTLVAVSDITSAEYTITERFSIPCKNIREVQSTDEDTRIRLEDCSEEDLSTLFNMVSISYSVGEDAAEVDNT